MKGGPEGSYYVFLMEHSSGADPYVCMLTDAGGGGGGGRRPIRRWTRTEKGLVVALSLSVILIIVVVVVTFTSNSGHNVDSQPNQRQVGKLTLFTNFTWDMHVCVASTKRL